jgi:MFS family permease
VLAAAILGSGITFIDGTVVNVALPVLQRELGASVAEAQWIVESYALMLAALILVGGSLGDRLGRRRVFSTGVLFFESGAGRLRTSPNSSSRVECRA